MIAALPSALRRRPLSAFFVLTYALAWAVWLPGGWLGAPLPVVLLGALAPTAAAFIVEALRTGRSGAAGLLRRAVQYRIAPSLYVLAAVGPLGVSVLATLLAAGVGGPSPSLSELPGRLGLPDDAVGSSLLLLPLVFAGSFLGGPLLEEIGWRGFAQPRLQRRIGAGPAGAVIGLAWSLWHLPLLHYYPAATADIPLPYYLPLVVCFGVCFAWMHVRSRGSVLSTIVLHAGVNFAFGAYGLFDVTGAPARLGALLLVTGLVAAAAFVDLRRAPEAVTRGGTTASGPRR